MKQAYNPYLPTWEYVPDSEPHVFDGRVYIYGSHDRFGGEKYCMNDYVCWSAPVDDLSNWQYEGVIYKAVQDPRNHDGRHCLYAPDVAKGADGRYYLYYFFDMMGIISVAVCDTPAGRYTYYGDVHYADGTVLGTKKAHEFQHDPGVLVDDDGKVYLYTGYSPKPSWCFGMTLGTSHTVRGKGNLAYRLDSDMLTILAPPKTCIPGMRNSKGTGFEGHEFYEASSMRKVGDLYYTVYSSMLGHELCYATSRYPNRDFVYGGTLVSNGDIGLAGVEPKAPRNYIGTNHGSIIKIKGQWYVFYHRQTNKTQQSRQGCAEPITILPNGSIQQVEMTSCGLNGGPLVGKGCYPASIACILMGAKGAIKCNYGLRNRKKYADHPCFTQDEPDGQIGNQYIQNLRDGAVAGYKYFCFADAQRICVTVRGSGSGTLLVYSKTPEEPAARIALSPSPHWQSLDAKLHMPNGVHPLYVSFKGTGSIDFSEFELQ